VRLSKRFGKKEVLTITCLVEGLVFLVACFIPTDVMAAGVFYAAGPFIGFAMAASLVLPDAILADCIDYDELHTAQRNEGLYTVIESNLEQYVEIIGGVLPSLIAAYAGFESNGGCSCGCGTKCDQDYLRWNCPNDAGYACGPPTSFDRAVLYGDPERVAPCTQQTEGAQLTFRLFFAGVPALCYMLAALPAYRMSISRAKHAQILAELQKREAAAEAGEAPPTITDPLTGKEVEVKTDEFFLDHFSASELSRARKATNGLLGALRTAVVARLVLWGLLIVLLLAGVIALKVSGEEMAFNTLVTLGCLVLAGVFVLIGWDGTRLHLTYRCPPAELEKISKSGETNLA
jgi:MFS family permease